MRIMPVALIIGLLLSAVSTFRAFGQGETRTFHLSDGRISRIFRIKPVTVISSTTTAIKANR